MRCDFPEGYDDDDVRAPSEIFVQYFFEHVAALSDSDDDLDGHDLIPVIIPLEAPQLEAPPSPDEFLEPDTSDPPYLLNFIDDALQDLIYPIPDHLDSSSSSESSPEPVEVDQLSDDDDDECENQDSSEDEKEPSDNYLVTEDSPDSDSSDSDDVYSSRNAPDYLSIYELDDEDSEDSSEEESKGDEESSDQANSSGSDDDFSVSPVYESIRKEHESVLKKNQACDKSEGLVPSSSDAYSFASVIKDGGHQRLSESDTVSGMGKKSFLVPKSEITAEIDENLLPECVPSEGDFYGEMIMEQEDNTSDDVPSNQSAPSLKRKAESVDDNAVMKVPKVSVTHDSDELPTVMPANTRTDESSGDAGKPSFELFSGDDEDIQSDSENTTSE